MIDTSDEFMGDDNLQLGFAERELEQAASSKTQVPQQTRRGVEMPQVTASEKQQPRKNPAEEWADRMLCEVENSKARVYDIKGNEIDQNLNQLHLHSQQQAQYGSHNSAVDDNYMLVA